MTAQATAEPIARRRRFWDVFAALRRPRVALMLALGVSSGLPFMLIGNTLGFWLSDAHVPLAAIGFVSWVGFTYTIKFVWGAAVDRLKLPLISGLGRRRSWMLVSQIVAGAGLVGMGLVDPRSQFGWLVAMALVAAVGAATQDTVIDAWRIEIAADSDELGLLTAAYTIGYRIALIFTESIILMSAKRLGWPISYLIFGAAMAIGMVAALMAREPAAADAVMEANSRAAGRAPLKSIWDAVAGPLIAFFRSHGVAMGALMLLAITFYHLPDYMRGPMTNPYYSALGLDKDAIALTRAVVSLPASFLGIVLGGLSCLRLGVRPTLIAGAFLQPLAVAAFAILGAHGGDFAALSIGALKITAFQIVMAADSVLMSYAGIALVAYMSTLTSLGYTATQYALLTSALALTGKFLKGFSGAMVEALHAGRSQLEAFAIFYLVAASLGLPAVVLCLVLARVRPRPSALSS